MGTNRVQKNEMGRNRLVDFWWFRVPGRRFYSTRTEDLVLRKRERGTHFFMEGSNGYKSSTKNEIC